ncbi:MAG: helix-turn-helix transcriptional regulator [Bacteroidaceae bacterium]|nr:helix-turn-helix transcriptional regulator [Bacteroidaceae bacterium]
MMHIGKRIREVLDEKGQSVTWFAQTLCYSRTNIYKIFQKETIDSDILMTISDILNHDFFKDYSEELDLNEKNGKPKKK